MTGCIFRSLRCAIKIRENYWDPDRKKTNIRVVLLKMLVCGEEEFNGVFQAGRDRCSWSSWYVIKTVPVFYSVISTQKPTSLLSCHHANIVLGYLTIMNKCRNHSRKCSLVDKTKLLIIYLAISNNRDFFFKFYIHKLGILNHYSHPGPSLKTDTPSPKRYKVLCKALCFGCNLLLC